MISDKNELLRLTPDEQQAADRDATILNAVRNANGPNAPSIFGLFPGAIAISELEAAAACGKMHAVKLALTKGEDMNGKGVMFGSPLHAAASKGHFTIVRLLVACGADTHALDSQGKSAAEVASKPEIAEFLRASE